MEKYTGTGGKHLEMGAKSMNAHMDRIMKVLNKKYGQVQRLTGGFTNAAFLLGTESPLVAKVAALSNQDLTNEMNALHFLDQTSLAPKYVDFINEGDASILVTTFEEGLNGQAILDTGNMAKAETLFYEMGLVLAKDIHAFTFHSPETPLRKGFIEYDGIDFVPEALAVESAKLLCQIPVCTNEWVLTHGDYGSHNILYREDGSLAVIDWEWTEWFHPLVDIAWTCWNTKLHYPAIANRLNPIFIKAYQSINPMACLDSDLKPYVIYKLWQILHRIRHADKATQEKWIDRLDWTFNHQII